MDKPLFLLAMRRLASVVTLLSLFCLSGCREKLTNLTVNRPRNPSHLYRFSVLCRVPKARTIEGSVAPLLVIDGKKLPLNQDPNRTNVYYVDYSLGSDRTGAKYYFEVSYQSASGKNSTRTYTYTTRLQEYTILEHGGSMLQYERAPVGAEVRIIGDDFTQNDRVLIGQYEVWVTFHSENAISFTVPPLMSSKSYPVYCIRDRKADFVGNLLIDSQQLFVQPSQLEVAQGDKVSLTVKLAGPAAESLAVNVTTNVPDSVIMPEFKIAAGEDSATVTIEGGEEGEGKLYISAMGYSEVAVPIKVYAPLQSL